MSMTTTFAQGKRSGRYGFLRIMSGYLALVLALAACGTTTTSTSTSGGGPVSHESALGRDRHFLLHRHAGQPGSSHVAGLAGGAESDQ